MKVKISLKLEEAARALEAAPDYAIDTETVGLKLHIARLVGISIWALNRGFYLPVGHNGSGSWNYNLDDVRQTLNPYLGDPQKIAIFHNATFDINTLRTHGIIVNNRIMDTMIAARLVDENFLKMGLNYKLKTLSRHYLKIRQPTFDETTGNLPISMVSIPRVALYAVADAMCTYQLMHLFIPKLKEQGLWRLFTEVEMPLAPITAGMVFEGIGVDRQYLESLRPIYDEKMARLSEEIYRLAGRKFNITSPDQLANLLYRQLGIRARRWKKNRGGPAVDKIALERIRDSHPIVPLIEEYRKLSSYRGKYLVQFLANINPVSGRVHAGLRPTASSGRYKCSQPNIQALPRESKDGPEHFRIRKAIVPPPSYKLVVADFSQIELRTMAFYSRDPEFLAAYQGDGIDLHLNTAKKILGVPPDGTKEQYKDERDKAKTLNFSIIYGAGPFRVSTALGVPVERAKEILAGFKAGYPGVWRFIEETHKQIQHTGQVENIFGRIRRIPGIWHIGRGGVMELYYEAHGEKGTFKVFANTLLRWCANTGLFKAYDAKTGKLIFKNEQNILYINRNYQMLHDEGKKALIPEKNFSYKRIRSVKVGKFTIPFTTMEEAFRKGANYVIQSTASEICKLAMIRLWPILPEWNAKLILQVHDELIFEVPEDRAEDFAEVVKEIMEQPPTPDWDVPI
ncbi:MAG: hypothetical protein JRI80_09600, partial [Deltaproteobacteria bacterium]|nr:hypothetical protein [Deltaproteobacteria bacterium]